MNAPTFNITADPESTLIQEWLNRAIALDEASKPHGFRVGQDNRGNICVKRGDKIVGGTVYNDSPVHASYNYD